jgi:hypothetical protein
MKIRLLGNLLGLAILLSIASYTFGQKPDEIVLTVGGEVPTQLKLARADLDKFPRHTVRAKDHDGKEYNYEGVALIDLLQKAGEVWRGDERKGVGDLLARRCCRWLSSRVFASGNRFFNERAIDSVG